MKNIVTLETAVLANKKGYFNKEDNPYYVRAYQEGKLIYAIQGNTVTGYVIAPTQSSLSEWLREKNVEIGISPLGKSSLSRKFYQAKIFLYKRDGGIDSYGESSLREYASYEECLEDALYKSLSLLPNG